MSETNGPLNSFPHVFFLRFVPAATTTKNRLLTLYQIKDLLFLLSDFP